jgi:fructose-1,6-bisphosphatase
MDQNAPGHAPACSGVKQLKSHNVQNELCNSGASDLCQAVGTTNSSGDRQLKIDMPAEQALLGNLRGRCAVCSSEESPEEKPMKGANHCVVFDPQDGSSIVGANLAVGTIFGVYPGKSLRGVCGRQQVAAGYALYGPRTDLVISTCIEGASAFTTTFSQP